MPKYLKEFLDESKELLTEEETMGFYEIENPERSESDAFDLHCVENPEVLLRLNSVVRSMGRSLYPNVNTAINYLWRKLSANAGLTFQLPKITTEKGKLQLPLQQFGGVFDALSGEYLDGISHKMPDGRGLDIQFDWERRDDTGSFQVHAMIVPGKKPKKEDPNKKYNLEVKKGDGPEAGNPRNKDEF